MEKRRLGRTGLEVTALSFGALPIQRCTMTEAAGVLNAALDAGVNFIDTARGYTDSEEKIGRCISTRRAEFFLATKSFARDRAGMAQDIDLSLATLQTEMIDLYQVHNIKERKSLEAVLAPGGALETLKEARQAGKIRFIGVTGHNVDLLVEAVKTGEFDTVQVPFNCVELLPLKELFPLARSMDVGVIAMKPLGGGQIDQVGLALRFLLSHKEVAAAIPGMDEIRHVRENTEAVRDTAPLTEEEQARLEAEVAEVGANFCRRCGYCMPCEAGIDIPTTFIFHLQYHRYGMSDVIPKRYAAMPARASDCIGCGICETRCPYDLPIRERMKTIAADLG